MRDRGERETEKGMEEGFGEGENGPRGICPPGGLGSFLGQKIVQARVLCMVESFLRLDENWESTCILKCLGSMFINYCALCCT